MAADSESKADDCRPTKRIGCEQDMARLWNELRQTQFELAERTKELECLYQLSDLAERGELTIEQILQGTADILPIAWQVPEQACGQINYHGQEFRSKDGSCVGPYLSSNLYVNQRLVGQVQVGYCGTPAGLEEEPFLPEERKLLAAVAKRLGKIIERRTAEQREESLRLANAYNRSLIEASLDPLVTIDPQCRITDVNRAAQRMTGQAREELIGSDFCEHFTDPARARLGFQQVIEQGLVENYELEMCHKDGHSTPVLYNASVYHDFNGQVAGVFAAARDITAVKRAERALEYARDQLEVWVQERTASLVETNRRLEEEIVRREKMEELARRHEAELAHVGRLSMLGEMASMLAHELNQPLAAIMNYAHGCARRLDASAPDLAQIQTAMRSIATEAERAGQIIRRTRTFVRKGTSERTVCDLNKIVREAVSFAESRITQNRVQLSIDLADDLPLLEADAIQLEQVLLNLIHNAIEAMSSCPEESRELRISSLADGESHVQITVADTGPGIAQSDLAAVFDPFFTTKKSGLGMGLSISRSILEAHHGRMWVTRQSGGGCAFHFRLPCGASNEPAAE